MEAIMAYRCEIDLSPGRLMAPERNRAGGILCSIENPHSSPARGSSADGHGRGYRKRTPRRAERLKPVADTEDGFYIYAAVLADLLAKPANVYVQRPRADLVVVAPDAKQQYLTLHHVAGILNQQLQKVVFLAGQP